MSGADGPPLLPDLDSGPRNFITTDKDHGGIALTVCTLMGTWVVLCFGVRMFMRYTVSGPFGIDDIVCSVATIFGVVQMVVFSSAISFGFGKALELLTDDQILRASKAIYAAQLLYIITNALTKCTVALLLARIVFIKSRVYACYAVLALSCLWGPGSFIAQAVRCAGHTPWRFTGGNECGNLLLAWKVITAFNVIIEALLFALPVWLVWNLKTEWTRKMTVVVVFGLRLPVVAAAILRVHFLANTIGSDEPLLNGVVPFICMNVEMHYGLMAATMPTLKPFVKAFNTGWGTYDTQGVGGYGQHSHDTNALESGGKKSDRKTSKQPSPVGSQGQHLTLPGVEECGSSWIMDASQKRWADSLNSIGSYGKNVTLVSTPPMPSTSMHSGSSQDSQQMFIQQIRTCEIHHEEEQR